MLDSEKIDAIFISLTNDIAPQATIDSLNKNIHVFCEKPPGRSVEDVKKVIAAVHSGWRGNTKNIVGKN